MAVKKVELILKVVDDSIKTNLNKQLHSEFGPAIIFKQTKLKKNQELQLVKEGTEAEIVAAIKAGKGILFEAYFWHGLFIPYDIANVIINNPSTMTADYIDKLDNQELRRIALERFGIDNYIKAGGFKVLHEDVDSLGQKRKLVQKQLPGDELLTGVFVTNSSPNGHFEVSTKKFRPLTDFAEHDRQRIVKKYENTGSLIEQGGVLGIMEIKESGKFIPSVTKSGELEYKEYFLQVHPELRPIYDTGRRDRDGDIVYGTGEPQELTCHNAVASTFGMYGDEYCPDVES